MVDDESTQPNSAVAQSFSESLDSVFGINDNKNNTLDSLFKSVQSKRHTVDTQGSELAAIESRLRDTEERLALASLQSQHTSRANGQARKLDAEDSSQQQAYSGSAQTRTNNVSSPTDASYPAHMRQPRSEMRPPNARADSKGLQPMPGAMPGTPSTGYGNDYIAVDRSR